jgi:AcrR family transcriptional regulator
MSVTVIMYDWLMSRWEPDARGRIALAAMELYSERGFDQTTVAEIAERAGLTERTFFRHFADKREVLFVGQDEFSGLFLTPILAAPAEATPMQAVIAGIEAVAESFEPRRSWSMQRHAVIAIAAALRDRSVSEPTASLAAQSGMAVFHVGFVEWVSPQNTRPFREIIADSLAALRGITASS